jgi:hypothetical protein
MSTHTDKMQEQHNKASKLPKTQVVPSVGLDYAQMGYVMSNNKPLDRRSLTPTNILQLQRILGNQAVLNLVRPTPSIRQQYDTSALHCIGNDTDSIQRVPAQLATEAYEDADQEKEFSAEEIKWIEQVLANNGIQVMLQVYGLEKFPVVTLHRVKQFSDSKRQEGEYSKKTDQIALSDAAYTMKDDLVDKEGNHVSASNEEEFKMTLIHELLHYMENHTKDIDVNKAPTAQAIMTVMLKPTQIGLDEYAFGWFVHPKTKLIRHFDEVNFMEVPIELQTVYEEKKWEKSPMPVSGDSISMEEDLATTFALALTSDRTRESLLKKYPLRYHLIDYFFAQLFKIAKEKKVE